MDNNNNNNSNGGERRDVGCIITDLSIENVTVYQNKAEVTRVLTVDCSVRQQTEICFEQISSAVDPNTIRVDVSGSTAKIMDVSLNTKPLNQSSQHSERLVQIRHEIKSYNNKLQALNTKKMRSSKQKSVLDRFTETLLNDSGNTDFSDETIQDGGGEEEEEGNKVEKRKVACPKLNPYDPNHLDTVRNFFDLYDSKGTKFDEDLQNNELEIEEVNNRIKSLENESKEIELRMDEMLYRELLIIMESVEEGPVNVHVTYVVKNCGWKPCYDIRVSNYDGTMKILYSAIIYQTSHEDWYQPQRLSVSTMEPGLGGTVPEICIHKFQYRYPQLEVIPENSVASPTSPRRTTPVQSPVTLRKSSTRFSSFRKPKSVSLNAIDTKSLIAFTDTRSSKGSMMYPAEEEGSVIGGSMTGEITNDLTNVNVSDSVQYEVARPPLMVCCDNKDVKVMICQLDFDSNYTYLTAPRLSPHAYQRATSRNKSNYTLLAGPANIFIDASFIGKTNLTTIHPEEEFICNLGVDKGLEIKYQPLMKVREPGSKYLCVSYRQNIILKNRHQRMVKITVTDRIPIANDGEKIKITLVEPQIKGDKGRTFRRNETGLIEWDHELASGASKEITIKFNVEHPADKEVELIQLTET